MAARHRAALYARQSITRDGSASLDVQLEACREDARRPKLDVVVELVAPPSTPGSRNRGPTRPTFRQLLAATRAGAADCVIACKPRRPSLSGRAGWGVQGNAT